VIYLFFSILRKCAKRNLYVYWQVCHWIHVLTANSEIVVAEKQRVRSSSLINEVSSRAVHPTGQTEKTSLVLVITRSCSTPFWSWHVRRISLLAQMSAQLPWSSSLIKPPEINSLMEAELFHLKLVAGAKPFPLSFTPSVSRANIEDGLLIVY